MNVTDEMVERATEAIKDRARHLEIREQGYTPTCLVANATERKELETSCSPIRFTLKDMLLKKIELEGGSLEIIKADSNVKAHFEAKDPKGALVKLPFHQETEA